MSAQRSSGTGCIYGLKDANISFLGASAPIVTGTTFICVREPY